MKFFLPGFCFVCIYLLSISASGRAIPDFPRSAPSNPIDTAPSLRLHYKITRDTADNFGYDIYANGKLMVHQPNIPGVQGLKGFRRNKDAQKVANLVIKKVRQGLMPPTVTRRELDSLKISY